MKKVLIAAAAITMMGSNIAHANDIVVDVNIADLDLTKMVGVQEAEERIFVAAREACNVMYWHYARHSCARNMRQLALVELEKRIELAVDLSAAEES